MSAASEGADPTARRPKNRIRRDRKVGPLSLSGEEMAILRRAAVQAGLTPGAYAAQVVVAVARQEITVLPSDVRGLVLELVQARAQLGAVGAVLRTIAGGIGRESDAGVVLRRLRCSKTG
ncbi:hypothetical protein ACRYCC_42805 [Actinomadura scrupuli]|uniref:hypothetical protein n=1 Tax=Actinomadura scrupuli TaxID=559629 RepID=UPI003D96DB5C